MSRARDVMIGHPDEVWMGQDLIDPPDQFIATTKLLRPEVELVPPLSDEFAVYGGNDTIERARQWALEGHYLLVRGVPACAHGLYLMDCPAGQCRNPRWADHINLWVGVGWERPQPFLLSAPYADEIHEEAHQYAGAHGLTLSSQLGDEWYGHGTQPIRLTANSVAVLWPIEPVISALLATQPISWPEPQNDREATAARKRAAYERFRTEYLAWNQRVLLGEEE